MEFRYQHGEESYVVRVTERPGGFEVRIGDQTYEVRAQEIDASTLDLWIEGRYQRARLATREEEHWVALDGESHHLTRAHRRRKRGSAGEGEETLAASMPGQIVAVLVSSGDTVERGQPLVIMEAMKMELRVAAPHDGTVARVLVSEGEAVERGQTLIEMGK
jgi:acetyl/propionyl-CoA carboxylase alpha subunit